MARVAQAALVLAGLAAVLALVTAESTTVAAGMRDAGCTRALYEPRTFPGGIRALVRWDCPDGSQHWREAQ